MKFRNYTAFVLALVLTAACSEPEREKTPALVQDMTRVTLLHEGTQDVAAYAFRRQDDRFLFDTLFRDGWTPDGKLSVRMSNGSYKFLFVSGSGENLSLRPEPLVGQTTWEEAAFVLRENAVVPGTYAPADELFLQFPASDAERIYTIAGIDQTIRATLSRAVCQIGLSVKRGYHNGTQYVEVPYPTGQSVLDGIDRIGLTVSGAGLSLTPAGSAGTAVVTATLAAADYAELSELGFARFDGPFVIPPADGDEVALDISVVPAAGSPLQPARLQLPGRAERNKRLDITLWITSGYPVVGVEIRVAPIDSEQDGDTGIWE